MRQAAAFVTAIAWLCMDQSGEDPHHRRFGRRQQTTMKLALVRNQTGHARAELFVLADGKCESA